MMKKNINQKMIPLIEYYKLINLDLSFNKSPIIRFKKEDAIESVLGKNNKLNLLKKTSWKLRIAILKKLPINWFFPMET